MTENTTIVSLDDRRPKAAPPVPQHWMERFSTPLPLNRKEMEVFASEAGLHVDAWIAAIREAGESQM